MCKNPGLSNNPGRIPRKLDQDGVSRHVRSEAELWCLAQR